MAVLLSETERLLPPYWQYALGLSYGELRIFLIGRPLDSRDVASRTDHEKVVAGRSGGAGVALDGKGATCDGRSIYGIGCTGTRSPRSSARSGSTGWSSTNWRSAWVATSGRPAAATGTSWRGRYGNAPDALDPLAEGLMFDIEDTSWTTDPELPPEWPAFAEWSEWMEENGYSVGDEDDERPLPAAFRDFYAWDLNGYYPSLATCVTSTLTLVARLTGREIDEAWLSGSHPWLALPHRL